MLTCPDLQIVSERESRRCAVTPPEGCTRTLQPPPVNLSRLELYGFSEFWYSMEDTLRSGGPYHYSRFRQTAQVGRWAAGHADWSDGTNTRGRLKTLRKSARIRFTSQYWECMIDYPLPHNINPCLAWDGVMEPPHEFFSELTAEPLSGPRCNFASLARPCLAQLLVENMAGSGQVTEL